MSDVNHEKELLTKLYHEEPRLSLSEIGKQLGIAKETVRRKMKKYEIPMRSYSEAMKVKMHTELKYPLEDGVSELDLLITELKDKIPLVKYKFKERKETTVTIPLNFFDNPKKKSDAVLTISLSDIHLGDADHLPDTYWSAINTLLNTIKVLNEKYKIVRLNLVLNGDIVSGRGVYRFQEFRNILHRGHWQVFVAEMVVKDTIKEIEKIVPVKKVYLLKGTHEALAENYILYLKKILTNAKYLGHYGVLNIAEPIGKYNVLFTHGTGKSDYYPVSYDLMRDLWKALSDYKIGKTPIERYSVAHSHWLAVNMPLMGAVIDNTGGFQKWEYSISQRPSGMILYLFTDNQCIAMPIKPDLKVEQKERNDPMLEYKNIGYYAETLKKHFKEIEMKDK